MGSVARHALQSASVHGPRRGVRVRWRAMDTQHASWFLCRWVLLQAQSYWFLIISAASASFVVGTCKRPYARGA
jgi:hypothetical protein